MTKMTPLTTRASTLAVRGSVVLALVGALAGCGGPGDDPTVSSTAPPSSSSSTGPSATSSSSSSSTSSSSPSSSSSSSSGRTLDVTIRGTKITPAPATIDLAVGETLTLVVTSDHADELHVHGFEVEESLVAGRPTSVELTGKEPGVYEVETHEPSLRLLKIAVR